MDQNGHGVERRLMNLETALAHATKVNDELSDIVADQSKRIEALERRVGMLMQREADRDSEGVEYVADQRPPHW
jgi:SlyX protein